MVSDFFLVVQKYVISKALFFWFVNFSKSFLEYFEAIISWLITFVKAKSSQNDSNGSGQA